MSAALVIAHPDDDCMFFSPLLASLPVKSCHVFCCSGGGTVRERELRKACAQWPSVASVHCGQLVDGDSANWTAVQLDAACQAFCTKHLVRQVFTFDEYGVSGHADHGRLASVDFGPAVAVYQLQSVWLPLKYSLGPVGALIHDSLNTYRTTLLPPLVQDPVDDAVLSFSLYSFQALHVMRQCYRSQLVWFRVLFLLLAIYPFYNCFERIK